jgi:uncharacterized protein YprB with RNaseH-like and TPR domain
LTALSDRLRRIIGAPQPGAAAPNHDCQFPNPEAQVAAESQSPNPESRSLACLSGQWGDGCFVVERRFEPHTTYGRETVGALWSRLTEAADHAPLVAGGQPARLPFVFFDLETTGLSGGAGTYAFLVGCASFDSEGAFITRQFLLTRFADERPLLTAVASEIAAAGALVSFNGKSFDAPLLETRYLYHRLPWAGEQLPHVDVLHPARRFWRDEQQMSSCSLIALERQILGAHRVGDVPGFEIPARYFQFIRSGDARPLTTVLEHNRLDLLSLAGLTARLLHLVRRGPAAANDAREALALGRVYARAGLDVRARDAWQHAADRSSASGVVRIESLRALALAWRRARQHEHAASCWRALLAAPACPRNVAREATDALAIHHEHRLRDLAAAKVFALRSLECGVHPASHAAVRHRLARIQRKIDQRSTVNSQRSLTESVEELSLDG